MGLGISKREVRQVEGYLASSRVSGLRLKSPRTLRKRLRRRARCLQDARCVAREARRAGVSRVVVGEVGRLGGAFIVYLRAVSLSGQIKGSASQVIDPARRPRASAAELLVRVLAPHKHLGKLNVEVDVPGAWIYVDGQRMGQGPRARLVVKAGRHALRVTHRAHRDLLRFVHVRYGKETTVKGKLAPLTVVKKDMKLVEGKPLTSAELPWYRRWWAVATVGAVVLAAGVTAGVLIPKSVGRDQSVVITP
jgi:hypothetical protein